MGEHHDAGGIASFSRCSLRSRCSLSLLLLLLLSPLSSGVFLPSKLPPKLSSSFSPRPPSPPVPLRLRIACREAFEAEAMREARSQGRGEALPSTEARNATHATIGEEGFRRAMRRLGVDVSAPTAKRLMMQYGVQLGVQNGVQCGVRCEEVRENDGSFDCDGSGRCRMREEGLYSVLTRTAVGSPARFWVAVDPKGEGARQKRRGWNRFGSAGLKGPLRAAHYGIGSLSLLVGASDFSLFLQTPFFPLDFDTVQLHASVHAAAAVLSLPRFSYNAGKASNLQNPPNPSNAQNPPNPSKFKKRKRWHLWMPTSREANMWPSALVYCWYCSALRSDFILPPRLASVSCSDPAYFLVTASATASLLYAAARSIEEEAERQGETGKGGKMRGGSLYASPLSNVLNSLGTFSFPILLDSVRSLLLSFSPLSLSVYSSLVDASPDLAYSRLYCGTILAGLFVGNLVCALSSAQHHGAVQKKRIGDLASLLTLLILSSSARGALDLGPDLAMGMLHVTRIPFTSAL